MLCVENVRDRGVRPRGLLEEVLGENVGEWSDFIDTDGLKFPCQGTRR
jgi:hypothetical protein